MKQQAIPFEAGLDGLDTDSWSDRMLEIGREYGSAAVLGHDHIAVSLKAGPNLLVCFEEGHKLRRTAKGAEPTGFAYTRRDGWSTLTIAAKDKSWFRDPAIYEYMDDLIDEGFFEEFENVLFFGETAGGYAACAYCVAAPGSRVLALSPAASMNPRVAGFDPRSGKLRQMDFTSRFGYAPDMVDAAQQAFIVHDPQRRLETTHAAMFIRDNVTLLRAVGLGQHTDAALIEMDILEDLIRAAMSGSLNEAVFADQFRNRREDAHYLHNLIQRAILMGHEKLALKASSLANQLVDDPALKAQLVELENAIIDGARADVA